MVVVGHTDVHRNTHSLYCNGTGWPHEHHGNSWRNRHNLTLRTGTCIPYFVTGCIQGGQGWTTLSTWSSLIHGACPDGLSGSLGSEWQRTTHSCPQGRGRPQSRAHGGQGPKWQLWACLWGWWHDDGCLHFSRQRGGFVDFSFPHKTVTFVAPQKQLISALRTHG